MVWGEDRKRALYMGANHGVPHKMNDTWEYDLPSNTWVLLKPPDYNSRPGFEKTNAKIVVRDGMAMTENGNPVLAGHVFWGLTYDPRLRELLVMNKHAPKGLEGVYPGPWLFAFDPAKRSWRPVKTPAPYPYRHFGCSFDYIPDIGKSLWVNGSTWKAPGTWTYDSRTNTWKNLHPRGPEDARRKSRNEAVTAYDSHSKVLVAAIGKRTYHYDIEKTTWTLVVNEPEDSAKAPFAADYVTTFGYDPVGQVCLLCKPAGRDRWNYNHKVPCEIWAYSVTDKAWTKLTPGGPPSPKCNRAPCGYFDPARNVFVNCWGTTVRVYRYKRAAT
jgi:hypothetical protein